MIIDQQLLQSLREVLVCLAVLQDSFCLAKHLDLLDIYRVLIIIKGGRVGIWAPAHWGLGEIDVLLVPSGKASKLLTDHLITGKLLKSEPAQKTWFSQTIHTYLPYRFP